MEQKHVDFSFNFEAEHRALVAQAAIRYLRDPVGYVLDVRKSIGHVERFRAMLDQWDVEAVKFAAFLGMFDAAEIRDWEENLQRQCAS